MLIAAIQTGMAPISWSKQIFLPPRLVSCEFYKYDGQIAIPGHVDSHMSTAGRRIKNSQASKKQFGVEQTLVGIQEPALQNIVEHDSPGQNPQKAFT